ncbi:MAG: response regulator transcription factor [Balneolales bacterium]|nr:response regulator transcription factor [Balneolales bacterium]
MKVLIIEDDEVIGKLVEQVLKRRGFETDHVNNGVEGEKKAIENSYDCIVLDLGLPDKDGLEICRNIRAEKVQTPLLILSAFDGVEIKVSGLDLGADDYLTKPFDNQELIARVEALIRRNNISQNKEVLKCGELELNLIERSFKIGGEAIDLTNNEFDLLTYFLRNQNRTISIDELSENVWDFGFDTKTNYVNVYLSYIRKKMKPFTNKQYIVTVRKKGFKMVNE